MSSLSYLDILLITIGILNFALFCIVRYALGGVVANIKELTKVSWQDVVELTADVSALKVSLRNTNAKITGLGNSKANQVDVNEVLMSAMQPAPPPPNNPLGG